MKVYSYDRNTLEFNGEIIARRDPLEKEEKFLIPAQSTKKKPVFEDGKITKFVNNKWILEKIPAPIEPTPLTLEEQLQLKKVELISLRCQYLKWSSEYYAPDFPIDILTKRQLARDENEAIKIATTLTALNAFNTTFE